MKEHEIIERLQRAITDTPIDLLGKLQNTDVQKMAAHDRYTRQEESGRKPARKRRPFIRLRPLLAATVFLIFLGLGWIWAQMPVTTIYLDINPSVALTFTRFHQVKEARAYNACGQRLLDALDLKGKDREEALYLLATAVPRSRVILLSVDTGENRRQEERETAVRAVRDHTELVLSQDMKAGETKERDAGAYRISPGKLELVEKAIRAGSVRPAKRLAELPLDELITALYEENIDIRTLVRLDGDPDSLRPEPVAPVEITWPEPATEPPVTEEPVPWPDDDWDDDDWDDDDDD